MLKYAPHAKSAVFAPNSRLWRESCILVNNSKSKPPPFAQRRLDRIEIPTPYK